MGASGSVRFQVLGPVTARRGEIDVALGGPQQQLALALLLADFGRPVSTDRLIDGIWGEIPSATARKTLQVYVSHLRARFGGDTIETVTGWYRIVSGSLDSREFEDLAARGRTTANHDPHAGADLLAQAPALWSGSAYAGSRCSTIERHAPCSSTRPPYSVEHRTARLVRQLEALGHSVTLQPVA